MNKQETDPKPKTGKTQLRFTTRLTPKKDAATEESKDLGIPVVTELQIRAGIMVAAGRTGVHA